MKKLANTKTLTFRMGLDAAEAMQKLAEKRNLSTSDFLRGIVEKIVAPVQHEQEAQAEAIKALPPNTRRKALRAVEIQKRLRELRAERPRVHVLSELFQDGSGAAQDAEEFRLEAELSELKKVFEAEVGVSPKAANSRGPAVRVRCVEPMPKRPGDEDDAELECPKCGEVFSPAEGDEDISCPKCGAELEKEAEADAEEEEEEEAEEEAGEEAEEEAGEEAGGEGAKTEADEAAERFLEITGLINSLRAVREPRSFLDNFFNGGPPVDDLLIKKLENERARVPEGSDALDKLRDLALRVVAIRKKIKELTAAEPKAVAPVLEKYSSELASIKAEVEAVKPVDGKAAKKGSWWDSL